MTYLARGVDEILQQGLEAMGGVVLQGPRACGKTTTGLEHCASHVRLDMLPELVDLAQLQPNLVLDGPTPRLIDEWQLAPQVWNAARHLVDSRGQSGQFIFCGSALPNDDVTRHTGAGRFRRLTMWPMSLAEAGVSNGQVSLRELAAGASQIGAKSELSYSDVARQAVRGGWPATLNLSTAACQDFNEAYLEDTCRIDLPLAAERKHDPQRIRRLLQSLARNVATEVGPTLLAKDVQQTTPKTIREDLSALAQVFVYRQLPAWSGSLRSRTRLRVSPKSHLCDPALALAALHCGPEQLALDPNYFGFIFESMVYRDLTAYCAPLRAELFHYREAGGFEVDFIIDLPNAWAGVEVKLGTKQIPQAEENLLALARKIDPEKSGKPAFLAIVTATEYAYTLPSGVHVIPLPTLTW